MEKKVNYKPANKVRTTKVVIIILAILCILASIPMVMDGSDSGFILVGFAIGLLLLAGLIEGFAMIVEAACEYSWEFDQKHSHSDEPRMDDAEVQ